MTQAVAPTRRRLTGADLEPLTAIVGANNILTAHADLMAYECDATTLEKLPPDAVVFAESAEHVQALVKWCSANDVPYVARGAGTGLSGGALAIYGGIIIELSRMNRVLEVDTDSGIAVVEAGVVNLVLNRMLAREGWFYAPDPSSQTACTIGGNVAENSGGPHTLKYGVTMNHVLGLEVVLPDGSMEWFGGDVRGMPGYDLTGLFIGSEGTFGIATKAVLRLIRKPESVLTLLASFPSVAAASRTVCDITAATIIPVAMEMIDGYITAAVEKHLKIGLPEDSGAVLVIELEGLAAGQEKMAQRITAIAEANEAQFVRMAQDDKERANHWRARKGAFGAIGLVSPNFYTHDCVVPRSKLPEVLAKFDVIASEYNIRICNVFHAGDGNVHPIVMFDDRDDVETQRALDAGEEIIRACIDVGGSLTGEHGIGFEKIEAMSWVFPPETLQLKREIREIFDPQLLANPGKVVPHPLDPPPPLRLYGARKAD